MLQCFSRSLAALALVTLLNQLLISIELVECSSRKFLTGFIIAYLLAQQRGGGSYGQSSYGQSGYGQSSYSQSSYSQQPAYSSYSPSYQSSPNIYVVPTSDDY